MLSSHLSCDNTASVGVNVLVPWVVHVTYLGLLGHQAVYTGPTPGHAKVYEPAFRFIMVYLRTHLHHGASLAAWSYCDDYVICIH